MPRDSAKQTGKRGRNDDERLFKNTEKEIKKKQKKIKVDLFHPLFASFGELPLAFSSWPFSFLPLVFHFPFSFAVSSFFYSSYILAFIDIYPLIHLSQISLLDIQSPFRIHIDYLTFSHFLFVSLVCLLISRRYRRAGRLPVRLSRGK